ncbi:hypothetical protein GVN24_24720 [Rhizobium sp. CRIBSB]|nr:hypothetical protein [Rhizobium sp. CRIBSB]
MPDRVLLKTTASPTTTPARGRQFIEKDWAIRRGATKALLDFSNPETVAQTGNIATNTVLNNLCAAPSNGSVAGPNNTWPPVFQGTLRTLNAAQVWQAVGLPVDNYFYIPAAETEALVVFWLRLEKSGWAANVMAGVIGVGNGANAGIQWAFYIQDDAGDGVLDRASLWLRTPAGANLRAEITGADLDALANGSLHQVGLHMTHSRGGLGQCHVYVDGVLKASSGTSAMTAFNRPTGGAVTAGLFGHNGFGVLAANPARDTRIGRPQIHYLDNSGLTVADILARDVQAAAVGGLA